MLLVARCLAWLPLWLLQTLGAAGGWLAYGLSGSYRRKLQANLIQAQTQDPALQTVSFGQAARGAGRFATELLWVWFRPRHQVQKAVVCGDLAVLEAAEQSGKGILFLTPHLGCFEITARFYASRKPITVLFKPPKQPALAGLLQAARGGKNLFTAPANLGGVKQMLKALRRGEAVGLLPDQVPSGGEGQWAPFYGRDAYTMTLPLGLAQSTGAVVVLAVGQRLPMGAGYRLHLRELKEMPTPEQVNLSMQHLIRLCPEQYLWGYNRYKQPDNAPSPTRDSDAWAGRPFWVVVVNADCSLPHLGSA
jgi:Kdo2-lipid IVA lauroyltransferase/acyltransferase